MRVMGRIDERFSDDTQFDFLFLANLEMCGSID